MSQRAVPRGIGGAFRRVAREESNADATCQLILPETHMARQRSIREKALLAFSVVLFGLLNLVPGLFGGRGSLAYADYGGGGGGGAPSGPCQAGQTATTYSCSSCTYVSCTPLPCHYENAYQGTKISYWCVNGQWQSGWSSVS